MSLFGQLGGHIVHSICSIAMLLESRLYKLLFTQLRTLHSIFIIQEGVCTFG